MQLYAATMNDLSTGEETLYRLNPATNKPLWHFSMQPDVSRPGWPGYAMENAQVVNGILYFEGPDIHGYDFYALNASNGTLLWKYSYTSSLGLFALRTGNGSILWQQSLTEGVGNMTLAYGKLYAIIHPDGPVNVQNSLQLEAFNASDGHVDWLRTKPGALLDLAIDEHFLYMGGIGSNTVTVLDRLSGKAVTTFPVGDGVNPQAGLNEGRVLVFSLAA